MNSEEIEKVLKYFMEPVKKGINWIMYSKYKTFDDIISDSYARCYTIAKNEIENGSKTKKRVCNQLP